MTRVKIGARYRYVPVGWDITNPPYGIAAQTLAPGDIVVVGNLPGCPRAGTMGHCYIFAESGEFAGLVLLASLQPRYASQTPKPKDTYVNYR